MNGLNRLDTTLTPLLGRLMLAAIFIWAGLGKAMTPGATTGYIAHVGLPVPQLAYIVAVVVELAGGILLAVGFLTRPVAAVLAVWTLITALIFHANFGDQMQMINFYKNIAIAGGFLYVAANGAGLWSVDAMRSGPRHLAAAA